jgi:hypothetical protein
VYTEFNAKEENLIRVPLGVSTFPYDAFPVPKAGAETTTTNLKFFRGECGDDRTRRSKLMMSQNANTVGISPAWRCTRRWSPICATSLASSTMLSQPNGIPSTSVNVSDVLSDCPSRSSEPSPVRTTDVPDSEGDRLQSPLMIP